MDESQREALVEAKLARRTKRQEAKRLRAESKDAPDPSVRREFFESARIHASYIGLETDEGRFIVSVHDGGVGQGLFVKRSRPEFRVLRRAVNALRGFIGDDAIEGRLFVDVGANIGTEVVSALRSHRFGYAVCCEPAPDNYRLLRTNLMLNGLDDRVRALEVAASDASGRAQFVTAEGRSGCGWIAISDQLISETEQARAASLAAHPEAGLRQISVDEVDTVTLDQLCENGTVDAQETGLLWIDAEGHEAHVLAGAGLLTRRGVPVVVEFDPEGLVRRGDRDRLIELVVDNYTHFLDVRRHQLAFELTPVIELASFAERLIDPEVAGSTFTDLLFARLDT